MALPKIEYPKKKKTSKYIIQKDSTKTNFVL